MPKLKAMAKDKKKKKIKCLTLFQMKKIRVFQIERVSRRQFKFDENGRKFSKRIENTVSKGEISAFPTALSKDLYDRHVNTRACLVKS